jgi:ATP-binding cassette subfamily G (WHITE) protein 2 (SNQ2)
MFLDGRPLPKSFSRYMGYVVQEDIHLPSQTVREALQVTASLRRSVEIPWEEKDAYVEAVIEMLEMEDFADALIGVPGAGLSLEQRKRVTVGVELAAKPDILFLDEPSSGLDGQSAVSIISLLRKLANAGQAIICTIHQPAAELIDYFDTLILLARGGKMAYNGPLGPRCSTAIEYFSKYGRACGERENPAEYFLDVTRAGSRSKATNDWAQVWIQSDTRHKRGPILEEKASPSATRQTSMTKYDDTYAAPFHVQLQVILSRNWLYYWREPDYATSKLWMNVGNSLLNSLTYLQSPSNQKGAYGRVFSAFMSLIVGPPLGLQVEPRFVALRDIFIHREKASLTYHWLVFVLAAIIIELPYALFTSFVYWILWYYPVGYFYSSSRAGYSFLMYELFAVFATSLAQLCAAVMPNLGSTFMANGFFFMFCNTFAGTLSPEPVTPAGWRWYYNVSPLFYLGEGVTTDVLQGLRISCDPSETSIFNPPGGMSCGDYAQKFLATATGYLLNPASNTNCEYCRYKDGQSYVSILFS